MAGKSLEKCFERVEKVVRGRKAKNKTCGDCETTFHQVRDLEKHLKNRKMVGCGGHCDKMFCNFTQLRKHKNSIQISKEGEVDFEQPLVCKTGYEDDPGFHKLVEDKKTVIQDDFRPYTDYTVVNKQVKPDFTYGELQEILTDIYSKKKNCFKLNMGIAYALFDLKTEKFRYHYISTNSLLFENAITIANRVDLDKFLKRVFDIDIPAIAFLGKTDSSSTFAGLTNLEILVYDIRGKPIGRPSVNLPSYIKNSKSIISLTHDGHKEIKDNLCMFRCLALYFRRKQQPKSSYKNLAKGLQRSAKSYKAQLEQATGLCFDKGVCISHIPDIEKTFEVAVNVYDLQPDGMAEVKQGTRLKTYMAEVVYPSKFPYPPMHLNLFKNHFSYITKFSTYANRYQCQFCQMIFDHAPNLSCHVKTCSTLKEDIFVGGKYRKDRTLSERPEDTIIEQ